MAEVFPFEPDTAQPVPEHQSGAGDSLVELHDVGYAAGGTYLIDDFDLRITRGSITMIMGPNGAGKSLSLRLIQGLLAPDRGRIIWPDANDRDGRGGQAKKVAIVFQKPVLLRRSVKANLRHALAVYGVPARHRSALAEKYLAMGQLLDLADRPARVLSGGEQQRLSIVRALAAEPELLLLDEPTASLDPQATQMIEALIANAHGQGTTIVCVTHDPGQARRLADTVAFVHKGRVTEHGSATGFFANPKSEAARAYFDGHLVL